MERFVRLRLFGKQRQHPAALPAVFGRGHARLAKQRLFGVGLRVGVFYRHAQRVQCIECVAQGFNPVFRAHQAQFIHGVAPYSLSTV